MELMTNETVEQNQADMFRELADIELALVGGGMGSVCFDDD